ncbi:MAG: hypothetical protein AAF357_15665, partial [Verrucomicrobiota bacterium]
QQMHELSQSLQELAKDFDQWLDELLERLKRGEMNRPASDERDSPVFEGLSSALSIGLILLVASLVGWLGFLLYRKHKSSDSEVAESSAVDESVDLHREDIMATELPEDEWMKLAQEQIAKGDGRLAVRALFLASLAKLGDEDLIKVARFKSNLDYRKELTRKARKWAPLKKAFSENVSLFERAWYGWHEVTPEIVASYLKNHELIVEQSKAAGLRRFNSTAESVVAS